MFAEIPEGTTFEKRQWAIIKEGKPFLFQIIDEKATHFSVHVIPTSDNRWIKVPYREDSSLMAEEWFKQKYRRTNKYQVNILDVTPSVVNPSTGTSFSAFNVKPPERDPETQDDLRNLPRQPLNKIKILEGGKVLFSQLNGLIGSMTAENPDLDFHKVVFQCQASGSGKSKVTTVFPRTDLTPQETLGFDCYELVITDFSDEEISRMLKGTPVRDIYNARREESAGEAESEGLDFSKALPGLT